MQTLLLLRHGIAEEPRPGQPDAERALTAEGVKKTGRVAAGLARLIDAPDVVLTSPKLRSVQTAEIVGRALRCKPEILDVLGDGTPEQVIAALRERTEEVVMVVGHEPTFSRVIQLLCAGRGRGSFVELKKAGCACVEVAPGPRGKPLRGVLCWLATPRMLKRC